MTFRYFSCTSGSIRGGKKSAEQTFVESDVVTNKEKKYATTEVLHEAALSLRACLCQHDRHTQAAFNTYRLGKEPCRGSMDQLLEHIPMVSGGSAETALVLLLHPQYYFILS